MNTTFARLRGASLCAIAVLAGCSAGTNTAGLPASAPSFSQLSHSLAPAAFPREDDRGAIRPPLHPLAGGPGWFSPDAKRCKQKLFVSSFRLGYVSVYCAEKGRRNQAPIGEITAGINGPEGDVTDAKGNLYVANTDGNTVTEYARGSTSASFTYSAGLSYPAGVAVDARQKVYVTNLGSGSVTVFPQGSNTPSLTMTGIPYPIDVALDSSANVYVTSFTANFSNGEILEYAAGSTTATNLGIVTKTPGGVMLDKSADIVTADQRLPGVLVFPPGQTSASQTFAQNMNDPVPVRFSRSEQLVFVGDSIENDVEVYAYPGGSLVDTITDGIDGPEGLALDPAPPLPQQSWYGDATGDSMGRDAASKQVIYVSSTTANTVYIYPKKLAPGANPSPIGEITDGIEAPSGSFVDRQGDLFVANNGNFTVTMYPRGSSNWTLRYTGFAYPNNVTVSRKGTVYIADFTGDKVVEFPKGSTRSKLTIQIGYPPHGVALDAHDNLYVSYNTGAYGEGPGAVNEYPPGSTTGINLNLPIGWAAATLLTATEICSSPIRATPRCTCSPRAASRRYRR